MLGLARAAAMGWLTLTTGLGGIIAVEVAGTTMSTGPVTDKAGDRVEIDDPIPTIIARSAPATVDAILERPLFSASRKPAGVTAAGSAFQLIGTMVAADMPGDGASVAILRHQSEDRLLYRAGETIDGWTIAVIEPSRIELRRDDDVTHLQLKRDRARAKGGEAIADPSEANALSEKAEDGSPDGEKPPRMSMEELEAHVDDAALEAWLESDGKNVKQGPAL